jgi:LPS-assembly protein
MRSETRAETSSETPLGLRRSPALLEGAAATVETPPVYGIGSQIGARLGREINLYGQAEMRRAGTVIRGERLTYWQTDDEISAVGNVRMLREGNVFTGPELRYQVDAEQGHFDSPKFSLPRYSGHGQAQGIDFLGPGRLRMSEASYTTCKADNPDWYLRARAINVDETTEEGEGESGQVIFKGRPILWAPSLGFPLGEQRRSGFLAPTFSLATKTGPQVLSPYYFDIAPNRDFTAYTRMMSLRGVQLGGSFRYLEPTAFGETRFELNPSDPVTHSSRYFWSSQQTWTNFYGWSGNWLAKGVSDDNYFVDYANSILTSSEHSLPRTINAARGFGDWTLLLSATKYQNILEASAAPPYERVPQIAATWTKRDYQGLDMGAVLDATVFRRPLADSLQGLRLVANPSISMPIVDPGWFVTPRLGLHSAAYQFDQNPAGMNALSIVVPSFSVDSGLIFERDTALWGRAWRQTLEPRLFYLYTPYRDQSAFPLFDTAVADFNFSQLFSENRYIGNDRVGDANQVTAALVSRLIDPATGAESLRVAAGERFYLSPSRVLIPGQLISSDTRSDLLLAASAILKKGLSVDAGVQYSVGEATIPVANGAVRWHGEDNTVFNTVVRYQREALGQFDTSWRLPVGFGVYSLGRLNYSFLRDTLDPSTGSLVPATRGVVEGLLGVEYREDCWALRLVMQRFLTAASTSTTALFVQLELSGFGRLGNNPLAILQRNIPGYRLATDRPALPSRYFGYE